MQKLIAPIFLHDWSRLDALTKCKIGIMKNYGNQVISIVVTFVVTMMLNVGIEIVFKSNGSIQIDEIQLASGAVAAIVRVENYSRERINDLKILIPKDSQINKISTSTPIQIEGVNKEISTSKQKIVSFSLIPSKAVSTLIIPVPEGGLCCSVINYEELNLEFKSADDVLMPSMQALYKGLQTAVIYTLFFAFFLFWYKARINELATKLESIEEKYYGLAESTNKRIRDIDLKFGRHKLILLKRLSDYTKELDFWRDSIRKTLYQSDVSSSTAEKIIAHVTQKLGTFGTRSNSAEEFDTIQALAQDIVDQEGRSNS